MQRQRPCTLENAIGAAVEYIKYFQDRQDIAEGRFICNRKDENLSRVITIWKLYQKSIESVEPDCKKIIVCLCTDNVNEER